ncbi:methyltransferase [Rothia sp. LK2588]|uniref:class I SAM-dependent methyltransferase n=1 Tax=Rothia sp. LK2588 TaxID=3114369 RepID=UPI0034CF44E3
MANEHYFSETPAGEFTPRQVKVRIAGEDVTVTTGPGIFSPAGIDKGTAILLAEAPAPEGATVLDIGTGWGPLTLTLAKELPQARVIGVEVNERSAQLTRDNATALGLGNVEVYSPESVPADLSFDTIWSNPPIRVGKDVLHGILRTWMPRLAPGGRAYLVVQKNLGSDSLQKWLAHELESAHPGEFEVSRYATSKSFRILEVARA